MDNADTCTAVCGDKALGGEEECDDGNVEDGDGCSSSCMIEVGYSCVHYAVPPYPCGVSEDWCMPVCGDGLVLGSEVWEEGYCDDGNLESGDGCSRGCQVECGYTCGASRDTCETVCGDGLRAGSEACDDGNSLDGDGCSSTCEVEAGWTCSMEACRTSWCSTVCGDGLVLGSEECDDGNYWAYDGCSGCQVECGWDCSGGECAGICGDGMRKGAEECDDGNTDSGDGCSRYCMVEAGFTCSGAWSYWKCGGPGDTCLGGCGGGTRPAGS